MKAFSLFSLVNVVLIILASISTLASAEESIHLTKPPASLAQWYKPQNKRNVWQHNMFKLRREIQAVKEYVYEYDAVAFLHPLTRFTKQHIEIMEDFVKADKDVFTICTFNEWRVNIHQSSDTFFGFKQTCPVIHDGPLKAGRILESLTQTFRDIYNNGKLLTYRHPHDSDQSIEFDELGNELRPYPEVDGSRIQIEHRVQDCEKLPLLHYY